jgi:hypothetical protein
MKLWRHVNRIQEVGFLHSKHNKEYSTSSTEAKSLDHGKAVFVKIAVL